MKNNRKIKKFAKVVLITIVVLLTGFISYVLNETKDEINADMSTIDSKLKSYYNEKEMAGFSVSVFNADSVFYSRGFGFSDVENKVPYTSKTLQYIASVSKTTIGVSLMKLQELGLLHLDDPINKHLPFQVKNPNFSESEITIRHLATHTSSIDYNERVVESLYIEESEKDSSLRQFMEGYFVNGTYGKVNFTNHRPGENWNYSNIAAGLAAYIVELKSNMTYADFTQKYIFKPLELKNTFWFESKVDSSNYTKYYEPSGDSITNVSTSGVKLYPCRDLITNVEELTVYCQALLSSNSKLLSSKSYNEMLSPQLKTAQKPSNLDSNGIFCTIDRNQYGITYQLTGMNGGDNCINTMMWFDEKTKLGYIFIGNTGGSKFNSGNHIWIYRALVSLGDHIQMTNPNNNFIDKIKYKWYNLYSRVNGLF